MKKRDYYEILGISRNATDEEVKKSYRRLAMKYHPDRNPNDKVAEEHFKEVQEAYAVISDSQKRSAYDQFGHAAVEGGAGGFGGMGGMGGMNFSDVFGDIFGDIFGGGHGGGPQRGADLRYHLEISLEQAVFGTTAELTIPTLVACAECHGAGTRKGSSPVTCHDCAGHGQVRMQQGFFTVQQTCPTCRGRGRVIKDPCPVCHGAGRRKQSKKLSVKVPPGVDTGDRIRLAGEGEAGEPGGSTGDLYVQVQVKEHAIFARDGMNLHCEMPITFTMAALGGEIEIPTLKGRIKLKIPAGTQPGKSFRIKEMGVPAVRGGGTGDLLCQATIEVPVNLNHKQKELLQEFDQNIKTSHAKHSPHTSTWFDKMKNFFEDMK
ncbi:molecular chaperone DnaJ [Gammaproteobacteria bacterium SCGC AG-212-F23]|nr:molecular chaperone DnaJ [Gammaproteobacteria bacterium SCGC AG-212-F23]